MAQESSGYRAFPPTIRNPSNATVISESDFGALKAAKMQEAPPVCDGHAGTTVWYAGKDGYIIQIRLTDKPDVFVKSICTFTPTMGMDRIDGEFAQDIEEYVLHRELGYPSTRLKLFEGRDSVPIEEYLKHIGFLKK